MSLFVVAGILTQGKGMSFRRLYAHVSMLQIRRRQERERERECLLYWNFIHFIIYVNGYVRLDIINEMCFENIYACKEKLYTIILLKYIILNGYTQENPLLLKN